MIQPKSAADLQSVPYMHGKYQIIEEINNSTNARIYRALRVSDGRSVILKIHQENFAGRENFNRNRNELEIVQAINGSRVIRCFGSEQFSDSTMLVMEDIGGRSLCDLMKDGLLSMAQTLLYGSWIAEGLDQIHSSSIIHKDISPHNIIVNEKTRELKIIDFDHSMILSREQQLLVNPSILAGTLAYMSPEQTGRMNRTIDYRSDYYSFGATLYQMLTGTPPFVAEDPLDLVHMHIARQVLPPCEVDAGIPQAVSDIVMKLLSKNAEDRYQSGWGIMADLEECLVQWNANKTIKQFALAQHDRPHKFQIPQKLYGREIEVQALLEKFDKVAQGSREIICVAGYSGIGKTSLVREVYKSITASHGYFIAGEFNQFQRATPFSALLDSLRDLIKQVLTENEEQLDYWRVRLQKALGSNGQLIINALPDLEIILGPQPAIPKLEPAETQNRINLVFRDFILVFCQPNHPLVIFLDDLQWIDSASLKFLGYLLADESMCHLMVIGTYRDNEVDQTHPLMSTLNKLKKSGIAIDTLMLKPLTFEHVSQLVFDTLHCSAIEGEALATLLVEKTDGNPFFIEEFLKSLDSENLLSFNSNRRRWEWDMERIRACGITDNVVDLMTAKLERLNPDTRRIVLLAACLGNRFDILTLATIYRQTVKNSMAAIMQALHWGLLNPAGPSSDWLPGREIDERDASGIECRFSHDRVQQAAYGLIPDDEKPALHKLIGELLVANTPRKDFDKKIFDTVTHLSYGAPLISDEHEKKSLVKLALRAAKIAKYSGAYDAAFGFLKVGLKVMPDDEWQRDYSLAFELYAAAVDAAHLSGNFTEMEPVIEVALAHAANPIDKIRIYEIRIAVETSQGRLAAAIALGLEALRLAGIYLPSRPSRIHVIWYAVRVKLAMIGKDDEVLLNAADMPDPLTIARRRLLGGIGHAAFAANPKLFAIGIFESLRLTLKQPNTRTSASIYAAYGALLCGILNDIEVGNRFGALALRLADKLGQEKDTLQTRYLVNAHVRHWKEPVRDLLSCYTGDYQHSLEMGDLGSAAHNAVIYCYMSFHCGRELDALDDDFLKYNAALKTLLHQPRWHVVNALFHQAASNMRGIGGDPCSLSGDKEEVLKKWMTTKQGTALHTFYFLKQYLCYHFGRHDESIRFSDKAKPFAFAILGSVTNPIAVFYDSLARIAIWRTADPVRPRALLRAVGRNQKKMKKWAHHGAANHLHKYLLVAAEFEGIRGNELNAINLYEKAIHHARKSGYLQEEALANELAAKFHFALDRSGVATTYLRQAWHCYKQWGAAAKLEELERIYPQLAGQKEPSSLNTSLTTGISSLTFDLQALMKALKNIAQEKTHSQLVEKTIMAAMECAGADCGLLILRKTTDSLFVEAEVSADHTKPKILQSIPLAEAGNVSQSVVNYVKRTQRSVVINDALGSQDTVPGLRQDPYIKIKRVKSVLCIPLMTGTANEGGELTGLLYLENNKANNAFDEQRLGALEIICLAAAGRLELSRKAMTDGLTNLFNHDAFQSMLKKEFSVSARTRRKVSVVLIDIDHFKKFNDTWGHQVGDMVLRMVADRFKESCRQSDIVARYGGEEMVAILPDTDQPLAAIVAERIRANIEAAEIQYQGTMLKVTVSLGVSTITSDIKDPAMLIKAADAALYRSKEQGRNQVCIG